MLRFTGALSFSVLRLFIDLRILTWALFVHLPGRKAVIRRTSLAPTLDLLNRLGPDEFVSSSLSPAVPIVRTCLVASYYRCAITIKRGLMPKKYITYIRKWVSYTAFVVVGREKKRINPAISYFQWGISGSASFLTPSESTSPGISDSLIKLYQAIFFERSETYFWYQRLQDFCKVKNSGMGDGERPR